MGAKLREKNGGAAQPADLSLNCKSVQARLATQWGYVRREWVDLEEIDFVGINQSCLTKMQAAEAAVRLLKEKNAQPADHCEDVLHMVRPQNCGTGYCSCIECPFKKGGK